MKEYEKMIIKVIQAVGIVIGLHKTTVNTILYDNEKKIAVEERPRGAACAKQQSSADD